MTAPRFFLAAPEGISAAQLLASNEVDQSLDLRPGTIKSLLPQNKALITHSFNLWLVPIMGYTGAAWATLACYASMMVLSWLKGQTVYPIPYSLRRLGLIVATAALCWVAVEQTRVLYPLSPSQWWLISGLVILGYFGVMWRFLGGWPVRNPA